MSRQISPHREDFTADHAFMSLHIVMRFLDMRFQHASSTESYSAGITNKGMRLGMNCRTVAIKIWLLVKWMFANVTNKRLLLQITAEVKTYKRKSQESRITYRNGAL